MSETICSLHSRGETQHCLRNSVSATPPRHNLWMEHERPTVSETYAAIHNIFILEYLSVLKDFKARHVENDNLYAISVRFSPNYFYFHTLVNIVCTIICIHRKHANRPLHFIKEIKNNVLHLSSKFSMKL